MVLIQSLPNIAAARGLCYADGPVQETAMRHIYRLLYTAILSVAVVAVLPVVLVVKLCSVAHAAWRKIELQAAYGGDEKARERVEWNAS